MTAAPARRRPPPQSSAGRRWVAASVAVLAVVALTSACSRPGEPTTTGTSATAPGGGPPGFAEVDAALEQRVRDDGLAGAGVLIAQGDEVVHRRFVGGYGDTTVVPIASASKWLTSAVIESLVDDGTLDLDAPVGRYLGWWQRPDKDGVTLRRLLSHQAGLDSSYPCLGDPDRTLRDCADDIADAPLRYPPGTRFAYGNAGYTVAAAIAESEASVPFETLFRQRIADPLGMAHTSFGGTPDQPATNPVPAASGRSTLDDYGRFVQLMARRGTTPDGRRLLSERAVAEIEADQLHGLDTSADDAVRITRIPTYGLGVWRDRVAADGTVRLYSGSGSVGFYPWIDREHGAWGVIEVADARHGAEHAVPASARFLYDVVLPAVATWRADHPPATTAPPLTAGAR